MDASSLGYHGNSWPKVWKVGQNLSYLGFFTATLFGSMNSLNSNRTITILLLCPHRTETITPNYVITVMKHKQNGKQITHLEHMAVKFKLSTMSEGIIMKIQYIL